jgi:hypothetical protein
LEFLVTVEDANENPVSGVTVGASDNGTDITYTGAGNSQSTGTNGQVTFTATSTTPQSAITFTFTEQDNNNQATATGSFEDGSGFSVTDPGQQTAGEEFNLAITNAQDVSGQSLDGSVDVTVTSDVDGQVHNAAVTFSNGAATIPVTLETATDHVLTVSVGGIDEDESFPVTVIAGPADNVMVTTVQGTAAANGSDELEYLVTVEDANENPVSGVTVGASDNGTDITYTGAGNSQSTGANGEVTFTATSTTPQSAITFTFTEQANNNQATATGSFEDGSGFSVTDPDQQTAGEEFNLAITNAQDVSGQSLEGSVNVVVTSNEDGEVHNQSINFNNGSGEVPITLSSAADHTLIVNVDGIDEDESVPVTVVAGPADNVMVTTVQGTAAANGSDELEYLVTVEDANENPVSSVTVGASDNGTDITYTGAGNSQPTGTNGQVTFTATSTTPQSAITFTFTEQDNNNQATATGSFEDGSGFSLTDPGQQTAGEEFNLAITDAQDVSGESLNGSVNVVVTSSVDGEVFGDPITFTDGSASVPVTLNTADDHTLTVNVDGVSNDEDIQVTVVAGDPEAITISDIVDPVLVNQAFDVTFTIHDSNQNTITDFNGNILLEVEFGEITPEEISLNPSNDGEVTEPIVLNTAGNNQMITAILQNDSEVIGESNIFEVTEE